MTDWLPWGAALMLTTLGALHVLTREGDAATNRKQARLIVLAGGVLTLVVYLLYLVFGERWLPYA